MKIPDASTVQLMLDACERHYTQLIQQGVHEDVARDRTWDAYETVLLDLDRHCADPRDRLFEAKLRTIKEKGNNNG